MRVIAGYILLIGVLRLFFFDKKYNKIFIFLAGVLLFALAASRSIEFGPDVIGYVNSYENLIYTDLSSLVNNFLTGEGKDPFFYVFSKILSLTGANYQIWLAILSGFFILSIAKIIQMYSPYPFISYISLISLGYFYFSLTGLRQTIALSFVLISYPFLKKRMLLPFLAIIVIGALFHSSALIFIVSYPLVKMKIGTKQILGIGFAFLASLFLENYIRYLVGVLGWTDTLVNYALQETGLTYSGFIIQLVIFSFCLFYKNKVLVKDQNDLVLYNLLFLGLIFQAFSSVIAEFFRISMYFSIFSVVLVPKAIAVETNKNLRILLYLLVFTALSAYTFWTNSFENYKFFWNL